MPAGGPYDTFACSLCFLRQRLSVLSQSGSFQVPGTSRGPHVILPGHVPDPSSQVCLWIPVVDKGKAMRLVLLPRLVNYDPLDPPFSPLYWELLSHTCFVVLSVLVACCLRPLISPAWRPCTTATRRQLQHLLNEPTTHPLSGPHRPQLPIDITLHKATPHRHFAGPTISFRAEFPIAAMANDEYDVRHPPGQLESHVRDIALTRDLVQ